jgi:3'-phosphoadenosine 5'-phosphosulfate sulfotransferase (PAPS reductase)/FAD synthetase
MNRDIIAWWSGGITSAVACKIAIDIYGKKRVRVIMIDTQNEHSDTYRFKKDCQKWYGIDIETITGIGEKYGNIFDVWRKHKSLNTATGAICSTNLKRLVREKWEKQNQDFLHQVFGFEFDKKEFNRALSMTLNHGKRTKAIYPLLMMGYDKKDCIKIVEDAGIEIPEMYKLGFQNNNCFATGCIQGGIGYWQKIKRDFPDKFNTMADLEHELTELKGEPVTMLKDQSNDAKEKMKVDPKSHLVFLKFNSKFPNNKSLIDMPECKVEPLFECNGMCGINDLSERNDTEKQINYDNQLQMF